MKRFDSIEQIMKMWHVSKGILSMIAHNSTALHCTALIGQVKTRWDDIVTTAMTPLNTKVLQFSFIISRLRILIRKEKLLQSYLKVFIHSSIHFTYEKSWYWKFWKAALLNFWIGIIFIDVGLCWRRFLLWKHFRLFSWLTCLTSADFLSGYVFL